MKYKNPKNCPAHITTTCSRCGTQYTAEGFGERPQCPPKRRQVNYLKQLEAAFGGTWIEPKPGTYEDEGGNWRILKVDDGWVGVALENGSPLYGHFFQSSKKLLEESKKETKVG